MKSIRTDLSFLIMIVLIFFGYIVSAIDYGNIVRNGIFMCVTVIVALFAYFMPITSMLPVCAIAIFVISGYMAYNCLRTGTGITIYDIFWVVWIPALTVTLWFFMKSLRSYREINLRLGEELNKLSGTDSLTQFKNTKAFINDCMVYMKISKRYQMDLCIMVFQLRYWDYVRNLLGREKEETLIKQISQCAGSALRAEDSIFITNQDPYNWCVLLYTSKDKLDIVRSRVIASLSDIDISVLGKDTVPLELVFGEAQYNPEKELNVMEFLNKANLDMDINTKKTDKSNHTDSSGNTYTTDQNGRIKLDERK